MLREYKRLGRIVCDARDGGLIDWDAIEDRTREVNTHASWTSPSEIILGAALSYRQDPMVSAMRRTSMSARAYSANRSRLSRVMSMPLGS